MHVSYRLRFSATCPVDPSVRDDYEVVIETDGMIKVEDLIALLDEYRPLAMFQEELTQDIMRRLATAAKVTTTGMHSGVETVCVVAP